MADHNIADGVQPHQSQDAGSSEAPLTAPPPSWSFSPSAPDSVHRSSIPRPSIFNSPSASRFAPPPSTSAVLTGDSIRPAVEDEPARTSPRHLNTLEPPPSPEQWRGERFEDEVRATVSRRRIPRVEKDADDPTSPISTRNSFSRQQTATLTTLSRLFAIQAVTSPTDSRAPSYNQQANALSRRREAASLPEHLYARGLLSGHHSDITVTVFGYPYRLHRLILDRAPFFASALTGPWLESNAKEITLHPEDVDTNITQLSFELALKRLYGAANPEEEDAEAVSLFATGCWLEMPDLIDSSIEAMFRQMTPETLSPLIKLVTSNYYGRPGDKILASAKAMLCRDGWKMPIKYWDDVPADIIREIVGGDGFFIDGEWDRWVHAKRLMDRRLKSLAIEAGLVEARAKSRVLKAPDTVNLMAVRFDAVYRRNSMMSASTPDNLHRWIMLYTHHDIEPLLVLLDEGIHYIHLNFEQLQYIRKARDVLGLPMMPEKVISNALWMQMELRQKVLNSRETDMELGLSQSFEERQSQGRAIRTDDSNLDPTGVKKGKQKSMAAYELDEEVIEDDIPSDSWDGNGKPRKFWIPSTDCNIVMGGNADPVIATSSSNASRLSATIQPEDVQWASDFAANTSDTRPSSAAGDMRPIAYTYFPPFRFAVEFPSPRLLKEKKRVYSQTIFYAGSWFNVYVQRVRRGKNPQLGVYLHRAKERETEEVITNSTSVAQGSVDERIGHLEREMLLRADRRAAERRRLLARRRSGEVEVGVDGGESSGSADPDATLVGDQNSRAAVRGLIGSGPGARKSSQTDILSSSPPGPHTPDSSHEQAEHDEDEEEEDPELAKLSRNLRVPTLPPYVDPRPTIRTYFKIYSPSKGGRMLSVFESAPDNFNFSQSWGWKSSTLMLDEGLLSEDGIEDGDGPIGGAVKKDGRLRFTIVIGNV
ncbi:hypothetical protein MBLNU459_g8554t1 [Dothideomycetes sp. NU459]